MTSLFRLAPAEPFRIFFPIGLLIGIVAVAIWPLYQLHVIAVYPAVIHARLMIEGFIAAFIFGFLGTAGPRMLSAPHLTGREVSLFAVLLLALTACHLASLHVCGDALFLALLVLYAGAFAIRIARRGDLPPPDFVLVLFGFASGMAGSALLVWGSSSYQLGTLLLFQGFVLFPMLGVGTFLFPRFLGLPIPSVYPDSRTPPPGWTREAVRAALFGSVILGTFFAEAKGTPIVAGLIRFVAAILFLLPKAPLFRGKAPGTLARALNFAIALLLLGLVLPSLLPVYRVAGLHLLFIGGFGFIVFLVATRVTFGHSGLGSRLKERAPFLIALTVLMLLSLVLRFAADFTGPMRLHLLSGAALCWIAGALIWGSRTMPRISIPDSSD